MSELHKLLPFIVFDKWARKLSWSTAEILEGYTSLMIEAEKPLLKECWVVYDGFDFDSKHFISVCACENEAMAWKAQLYPRVVNIIKLMEVANDR